MQTDPLANLQSQLDALREELNNQLRAMRSAAPPNVPIGTILPYACSMDNPEHLPDSWLPCDGRMVSNQDYPLLWEKIKVMEGATSRGAWGGDGNPNFNLPDLQGRFLRGVSGNTDRDPEKERRQAANPGGNVNNNVGSVQEDALQLHRHGDSGHLHSVIDRYESGQQYADGGGDFQAMKEPQNVGRNTDSRSANVTEPINSPNAQPIRTANETRVKNAYVHWIIRVK